MSNTFKYQEDFAHKMAMLWAEGGNDHHIRTTICSLKNKRQAAYISARMAVQLVEMEGGERTNMCEEFIDFMHPGSKE